MPRRQPGITVVADERWRFDDGMNLLKLCERAEDGNGPAPEAQAENLQRDRHATDLWRIEPADELHSISFRPGRESELLSIQ